MKRLQTKRLVFTVGILFFIFTLATPVSAQGLIGGSTVPAGTVLNQDVFLTGQNVSIDGDVIGNVFILGNQVEVNGEVDGSLILIGQNAIISGNVTGGVYAAAVTLQLSPSTLLERDLYILSVSLTSGKNSVIGRDLFAVGLDSGLNGKVARNLHTAIGPIQLYNGLMTLLGFSDLTIKLNFSPQQNPSGNTKLPPLVGKLAKVRIEASSGTFDWNKWAIALLRNWGTLFMISLLLVWVSRRMLMESGEPIRKNPWKTMGVGLLVMVFSILLIGTAFILAALVFEIGLGLNYLGLWQISLALWIVVYAGLALIMAGIWFFFTFGTKIIAIYYFSRWVVVKLFKHKTVLLEILGLLVLTIIYTLLRSLPYVGWVFGVLMTAMGAGAASQAYRQFLIKKEANSLEVKIPLKEKHLVKPVSKVITPKKKTGK